MKTLYLYGLLILVIAQKCPQDDTIHTSTYNDDQANIEQVKDSVYKIAISEWNKFRKESKKEILRAHDEITEAMDRRDDFSTSNKLELEWEIIKADAILEQLEEKFERGERFDTTKIDEKKIIKMDYYRQEYKRKEERLKKVLLSLRSIYYKK